MFHWLPKSPRFGGVGSKNEPLQIWKSISPANPDRIHYKRKTRILEDPVHTPEKNRMAAHTQPSEFRPLNLRIVYVTVKAKVEGKPGRRRRTLQILT